MSSVVEGCSQPQPGLYSLWARWMEGHGNAEAHSGAHSACGRDGGEESGSRFQKLPPLPEASTASRTFCRLQHAGYFTGQNRFASSQPGSQGESLISRTGQGQMLPAWMDSSGDPHSSGSTDGEGIPAQLSSKKQPGRDLQPSGKSRNWEVTKLPSF